MGIVFCIKAPEGFPGLLFNSKKFTKMKKYSGLPPCRCVLRVNESGW